MSLIRHEVDPCPRCGARHRFAIELEQPGEETILFGGPGDRRDGEEVEVGFTCPDREELFTDRVAIPAGAHFKRVVTSAGLAAQTTAGEPGAESEFTEWVKGSRTLAHEFCRTMLTTAAAAIPVYFAVLKYLGTSRLEGSLGSKATLLPPVSFLIALVLFALALRPQLASIDRAGFEAFRAERLRRLNRYIGWGVAAFAGGIAVALVLFTRALATL